MADGTSSRSYRPFVAVILSFFLCGFGQLYLRKVFKGFVLILSFSFAIFVIWISLSGVQFKLLSWDANEVMFAPAQRSISFRGHTIYASEIMKVTGIIQLVFTWIYGIIDAWREGRR